MVTRARWGLSSARRAPWALRKRRRRRPWPAEAIEARRTYVHRLTESVADGLDCAPQLPVEAVSFSSGHDVPELVACIRSFLSRAGTPFAFTVVSDGTHSRRSADLLRAVHPCVEVVDWRSVAQPRLPWLLWEYARTSWRGKKLLVLASLDVRGPLVYTDADVLFFPGAADLHELAADLDAPHYLPDCAGRTFLDRTMLSDEREADESVNAGFIVLARPLDWEPALHRLERRLRWKATTFTGQTVVHLTLHRAGAHRLDPARYVVADDDRERPDDPYVGPATVLRHYVAPVRHKFWTALAHRPDR
jgi:hypothetical protein